MRSNNYDAQYGRTGGGVISAVLKSGGNTLHGSLYEYYPDKILNANAWPLFCGAQGRRKPGKLS